MFQFKNFKECFKNETLLFLSFLSLYFLIFCIAYFMLTVFKIRLDVFLLLFVLFIPVVYGFFSNNSLKSFLFGLLILPILGIFNLIFDSVFFKSNELLFLSLPAFLFCSVLWGLTGYLGNKNFKKNWKSLLFILLLLVFLFAEALFLIRQPID